MYSEDIPCRYFVLAIVLLISARCGECLHCFQCQNVSEGIDCNVVAKCNNDASCYIERSGLANDTRYSLGCIPRQNCPAEHQFTMVGRSVQTQCKKCCSMDGCNKHYCEPVHPAVPKPTLGSCMDNPSENCSKWASLINICATPHRAKDICRKYCGLCDMVDGSWGNWHDWSTCTTTCGIGVESRARQCNDPAPAHGGYDCPGNINHQRSCFSRACPVHGGWSGWAQWEGCSESCGTGLKKRHRTCTNPPPSVYGHFCLGDSVDFSMCHGRNCGNHSSTTAPTASHCDDVLNDCNTANKTFGICDKYEIAKTSCAEFCRLCGIVDGAWAVWSPWLPCSTSCGPGITTRTRTCSSPLPQNGGKTCTGNNTETKHCTLRACPVHGGWGTWADWASCSSTCGQGITRRTRVCDNPRPQLLGNFCFGDSTEYGMCLIKLSPVDGGWTDWSFWSGCSVTCGNGHAIRQRSCSNPTPTNGGITCAGPRTEQNLCNLVSCSVNGGWTTWTSWSSCSSSVARGLSQRQRTCTNPSPSFLGRSCIGDSTDKRPCPADGGWTYWSFWSSCSVTCGNGHATRQRSCSNPTPANGGLTCAGSRTEQNTCTMAKCPVNGGWSTWTSWSSCSSSVARGLSQRKRTCTNPSPSSLGRSCIGDSTDKRPCPGVKSAFTVNFPRTGLTPKTIRFTSVITNIGGHYSTSTGIFTCVYPGIYVFSLHIMKLFFITDAYCYIRKNRSNVVGAWTDPDSKSDNGWYSSSTSGVIHLVHGDQVDVGGCSNITSFYTTYYTTFSGFLLKAD